VAQPSISSFLSAISKAGGMSMTNGYDIEFGLNGANKAQLLETIKRAVGGDPTKDSDPSSPGYLIKHLCDEAQLPNVQSATGQITGVIMGEGGISYPHTKLYSDFSLSWMCDANMTPLKFLTAWYDFIFGGYSSDQASSNTSGAVNLEKIKSIPAKPIDRAVRLNFPANYLCDVRITKTEKGKNAPNSRAPISYLIQDCYPYSIDAIPLSYGSSQITKVSANFYYRKHTIVYNNISNGYTG
jgi:hypothetical protein